VPLALAIVLGLVAMKVAKDVIANKRGGVLPTAKMTDVVVVKKNLSAGSKLRAEDLTLGQMSGELPAEAIFRVIPEVEGRVAKEPLFKGQPVLETLLTPKGTGAGLQALVPEGKRAITVEINEFSGVAGFLVPGCRVDVVATVNGDNNEMVSRTIVQNVPVSALGKRQQNEPGAEAEQVKSVTLIVTPKEAETIELAAATGRPRLVLRSSGDDKLQQTEGISVAELRGRSKKNQDPFIPIEFLRPLPPVTQTPTTQPQMQTDARELEPQWLAHTVRVIRAGVESNVTMQLERPQATQTQAPQQPSSRRDPRQMTNSPTEPVLPGQRGQN
jgi:pilus assembly protein CpaB